MIAKAAPRRDEIPASYEAERAILAAALLDSEQVKSEGVFRALRCEDFYWEECAIVWGAILACVRKGDPVTIPTVAYHLAEQGTIDRLDQLWKEGAEVFLVLLNESCYSATGCSAFSDIVKKYAQRREAINRGAKMVREGYQGLKLGWVK